MTSPTTWSSHSKQDNDSRSIEEYIHKLKNSNPFFGNKSKRVRRTKGEIRRVFVCSIDECRKSYGTEGALKMHVKLKHDNKSKYTNRLSPRPLIPLPSVYPQFLLDNYALSLPDREGQLLDHYQDYITMKNQLWLEGEFAGSEYHRLYNNPYPAAPQSDLLDMFDDARSNYPCTSHENELLEQISLSNEGVYQCNVSKVRSGNWQNISSAVGDILLEFLSSNVKEELSHDIFTEDIMNLTIFNPIPYQLQIPLSSIIAFASEDLHNGFEKFALELSAPPSFYSLELSLDTFPSLPQANDYFTEESQCVEQQGQMKWTNSTDFSGGNISSYRILLLQISKPAFCCIFSQFLQNPYLSNIYHNPLPSTELSKINHNITKNESILLYQKYPSLSPSPFSSSSPPPPNSFSLSPSENATVDSPPPISRIRENYLQNINNTPPLPTRKLQFNSNSVDSENNN